MSTKYQSPAMRELRNQQVRFVPREKRIEQVNRAESLFNELEDEQLYSYEYLCHKITDYRPHEHLDVVLKGKKVRSDVLAFIEDMSDAADLPSEAAGEEVYTIDDLSCRFNVATKTISRWRKQGLVSRRFLFNGRKRVGFLASSVSRFVESNPTKIQRGAKFSQLTEEERRAVVADSPVELTLADCLLSELEREALALPQGSAVELVRVETISEPAEAADPPRQGSARWLADR